MEYKNNVMWAETSAVGELLTLKPCVGTGNTHKDF